MNHLFPSSVGVLLLVACGADPTEPAGQEPDTPITNRIQLSPEIMGNLGISFATVESGALQMFLEVPGQLVAPVDRSWTVRAPSEGRAALHVAKWATVEKGDVIAELTTPDLVQLQTQLFAVLNDRDRARASAQTARAELLPLRSRAAVLERSVEDARGRLAESELLVEQTFAVAEASKERVNELTELAVRNALSTRELYDARVAFAEAKRNRALRRDTTRRPEEAAR